MRFLRAKGIVCESSGSIWKSGEVKHDVELFAVTKLPAPHACTNSTRPRLSPGTDALLE
ncbi:MAG: hypothetical protein U0792_21370 [Gemmataceae bacterium]